MNRLAPAPVWRAMAGSAFIMLGAGIWLNTIVAAAAVEAVPGGWSQYGTAFFAVAPDGTLYRADGFDEDRIMKVTPDGQASLFGTVGQIGGMTTDDQGDLYVSDSIRGHIVEFTPDGAWDIVASIDNPMSVAVDSQRAIYVNTGGSVVRIAPSNQPETIADHEQIPTNGLATDATGSLYLGDGHRGTVWRRTPDGGLRMLTRPGQVPGASLLAVDRSGTVFVTQTPVQAGKAAVLVIDRQGQVTRLAAAPWSSLSQATDVAVDGRGTLYVSDGSAVYRVRAPVPQTSVSGWLLLLYGVVAVGLGVPIINESRGGRA